MSKIINPTIFCLTIISLFSVIWGKEEHILLWAGYGVWKVIMYILKDTEP